jgi:hypothetical protein
MKRDEVEGDDIFSETNRSLLFRHEATDLEKNRHSEEIK